VETLLELVLVAEVDDGPELLPEHALTSISQISGIDVLHVISPY
jgi:hypothetical protein